MNYNVDMRIDQIMGNEQAAAMFDRFLQGMCSKVEDQPVIKGMSVRKLADYVCLPLSFEGDRVSIGWKDE